MIEWHITFSELSTSCFNKNDGLRTHVRSSIGDVFINIHCRELWFNGRESAICTAY